MATDLIARTYVLSMKPSKSMCSGSAESIAKSEFNKKKYPNFFVSFLRTIFHWNLSSLNCVKLIFGETVSVNKQHEVK
jgi:hypothetical protein